jgi:hypothetical protein
MDVALLATAVEAMQEIGHNQRIKGHEAGDFQLASSSA